MLVRFDDEKSYEGFCEDMNLRVPSTRLIFLRNGQRAYIRPSSVDVISRDGER